MCTHVIRRWYDNIVHDDMLSCLTLWSLPIQQTNQCVNAVLYRMHLHLSNVDNDNFILDAPLLHFSNQKLICKNSSSTSVVSLTIMTTITHNHDAHSTTNNNNISATLPFIILFFLSMILHELCPRIHLDNLLSPTLLLSKPCFYNHSLPIRFLCTTSIGGIIMFQEGRCGEELTTKWKRGVGIRQAECGGVRSYCVGNNESGIWRHHVRYEGGIQK